MKIQKVKKLVTNLRDKTEYISHIRNSRQALDHGLVLGKVFKFNEKAWVKPDIDMNIKLRQKIKNNI